MFKNLEQKELSAKGKTKEIWTTTTDPDRVIIKSGDDITAGNGEKHDILPGKGAWSTTTTCNVFHLLKECGIPVAFEEQIGATTFVAKKCKMIPLEVVVRREAHGSYLKRNPHLQKGHLFPNLICELYLKTAGRTWDGQTIPCDDPMLIFTGPQLPRLFLPSKPLWEQKHFLEISLDDFTAKICGLLELSSIEEYAKRTFLILEKSWQLLGRRLVDFKVEFGFSQSEPEKREILLSDVIDSDSWRLINSAGEYSDKQVYRDGGPLAEVAQKFRETAELSCRFGIPRQQIIIWRGSEKDDITPLQNELGKSGHASVEITTITCSAHKSPVTAYNCLNIALQKNPNSVVISFIGKSNGAGPMLSAICTVPVITVPVTAKEFPNDIWSSLRTPSDVPVLTVLEPKNAVLAALQILAARNPALYAKLRYYQEKRLSNVILMD